MGVLGIVLGWKATLLAFILATLFGAVLGVAGLALKLIKRGQRIPFGPYIVLATFVSYFFPRDDRLVFSFHELNATKT